VLPPLRDWRENIPLLAWHFINRRPAALGRAVGRVPERLMRASAAYSWPGNVRELEKRSTLRFRMKAGIQRPAFRA
jgi:DNA-binding NtrC family response regulator